MKEIKGLMKNERMSKMTKKEKEAKKLQKRIREKEENFKKDMQDAGIAQILKRHMYDVGEATAAIIETYAFPENYSSTGIRNACKIVLWRLVHGEIGF